MIIWGSTGKEKVLAQGQFYCPRCRTHAGFTHTRVERYFTLYFIPLFSTEVLGEYVKCHHCGGTFEPLVLQYSPQQIEAALQPWRCACGNNNSPDQDRCLACGRPRAGAAPPPLPPGEA